MHLLRRALHPHAERAIPVGAHVSERGRVAAWAGGISRALQSALDRPALGLPHASPGSPATSCTWSRCMNTLSSVSKKSGAKHSDHGEWILRWRGRWPVTDTPLAGNPPALPYIRLGIGRCDELSLSGLGRCWGRSAAGHTAVCPAGAPSDSPEQ